MNHLFYEKLKTAEPYSRAELGWLLDHIGDADASIRDDLVYASFCHALLDGLVTKTDFDWLAGEIMTLNLLFYRIEEAGQATLTRSFAALLATLLIGLDGDKQSIYKTALSSNHRQTLFQQASQYLIEESDATGWSAEFGWVHAVAHGADFLFYASQHPDFSESYDAVWQTIVAVFKNQDQVFTANEEKRLATVISQLILQEKIGQQDLHNWISQTDFPKIQDPDYLRWINYQNFILKIYMDLDQAGLLSHDLKTAIQITCTE